MLVSMAITRWRRCSGLLIVVGVGMFAVKGSAASEPADSGNGRSSRGSGQARSQGRRVDLANHVPHDHRWLDAATTAPLPTPVPSRLLDPEAGRREVPVAAAVPSLTDAGWRP